MKLRTLTAATLCALTLGALAADETETWKDLGNGLIRDDILNNSYFVDFPEFPVKIQESEDNPGRYRLVNAYYNCPSVGGDKYDISKGDNYIIVDATDPVHVYMEPGPASFWIGPEQEMWLWSIADDLYNNQYGDWDKVDEEGVCGTFIDGVITFPANSLLMTPRPDDSYDGIGMWGWNRVNPNGMFRIKLPGLPDFDVEMTLGELNVAGDGVAVTVSVPKDMDYADIYCVASGWDPVIAEEMVNGSLTGMQRVKGGEIETITVPYDMDGRHCVVAVPYKDEKNWLPSYIEREWHFSQKEWKKVGKADYTEAFLSSNTMNNYGFNLTEDQYQIEVEQNVEKPWIIRLVNPYGPPYKNATKSNYDYNNNYYMVIDLATFKCVRIKKMADLGIDMNVGVMSLWSNADRAIEDQYYAKKWTLEEVLSDPLVGKGHYDPDTREITFDKAAVGLKFAQSPSWYEANLNERAKIVLPSDIEITEDPVLAEKLAGIESVIEENGEAEYYTMDGVRVQNPEKGIYIVRKGNKTYKAVIR